MNYNEDTVTVFWDDGRVAVYPCPEGNHCLKILDNAPTGKSVQWCSLNFNVGGWGNITEVVGQSKKHVIRARVEISEAGVLAGVQGTDPLTILWIIHCRNQLFIGFSEEKFYNLTCVAIKNMATNKTFYLLKWLFIYYKKKFWKVNTCTIIN